MRAPSPPLAQFTLPRHLGGSLWTPNSQRYFPSRTWSSGRPGDRMAPKSSAHSELTPLNPQIARAGPSGFHSRWVPATAGFLGPRLVTHVCTYVCVYVRTYAQVFLMPHAVPHMPHLTCLAGSLMTFRLMLSVILCDVFSVTPQLSTRAHLLPSPPPKFMDSALSKNPPPQ